jgi:hypothetical protein
MQTGGSNQAMLKDIENAIRSNSRFSSIITESVEISGEEMTLNQIWDLGVSNNSSLSKDMDTLFTKQMV